MAKSSDKSNNSSQRIDVLERRIKALENANASLKDQYAKLFTDLEITSRQLKSVTTKLSGKQLSTDTTSNVSIINIPVQLSTSALLPRYSHDTDAGFDIRADNDYYIAPGNTVMIHTGLRMAIPQGYELQIRPRSGISLKTDLRVSNSPGTVDPGYLDEICVLLTNTYRFNNINARVVDIKGNKVDNPPKGYPKLTVFIKKGERIAQGVISKVYQAKFIEVPHISQYSDDRGGGFGSTGVK